jgi:hypothetical protein
VWDAAADVVAGKVAVGAERKVQWMIARGAAAAPDAVLNWNYTCRCHYHYGHYCCGYSLLHHVGSLALLDLLLIYRAVTTQQADNKQ